MSTKIIKKFRLNGKIEIQLIRLVTSVSLITYHTLEIVKADGGSKGEDN